MTRDLRLYRICLLFASPDSARKTGFSPQMRYYGIIHLNHPLASVIRAGIMPNDRETLQAVIIV
jgi:hypothetical protein